MKVEFTFNAIGRQGQPVTATLEFDVTEDIQKELDEAFERSEGGWDALAEQQHQLKQIILDDVDVSIIH